MLYYVVLCCIMLYYILQVLPLWWLSDGYLVWMGPFMTSVIEMIGGCGFTDFHTASYWGAKYEAKKYAQPGVDPPHVRLARGEGFFFGIGGFWALRMCTKNVAADVVVFSFGQIPIILVLVPHQFMFFTVSQEQLQSLKRHILLCRAGWWSTSYPKHQHVTGSQCDTLVGHPQCFPAVLIHESSLTGSVSKPSDHPQFLRPNLAIWVVWTSLNIYLTSVSSMFLEPFDVDRLHHGWQKPMPQRSSSPFTELAYLLVIQGIRLGPTIYRYKIDNRYTIYR